MKHTHMEYEQDIEETYTHIEYRSHWDYNLLTQSEDRSHRDYNLSIINERSQEMKELATDIEQLAEISNILGTMIYTQGEKVDAIGKNIEDSITELETSVIHLSKANEYAIKLRRNIRNAAIIIGSITAGACGFLAGPIVGIATTASGIATGIGLVYAAEKKKL